MSETIDVGFGMKCLSAALNAKAGTLDPDAPEALVQLARSLVPADPDALAAAENFRASYEAGNPIRAGADLLEYLAPMRAGFAWQDRADLR